MTDTRLLLVEEIVKSHFGQQVSSVCSALMTRGPQRIHQIKEYCKFDIKQVRECLLVGIQHNFIYWTDEKDVTLYRIIPNNILFRIRYPQCVRHILEKFSSDGVVIIEELLQVGRCTRNLLVSRVNEIFRGIKGIHETDEEQNQRQNIISEMMQQQYLTTMYKMKEEAMRQDQKSDKPPEKESKLSDKYWATVEKKGVKRGVKPSLGGAVKKKRKTTETTSIDIMAPPEKGIDGVVNSINSESVSLPSDNAVLNLNAADDLKSVQTGQELDTLWCINPERFNYEFRKELVLPFSINPESSEFVKACFNIFEQRWSYSDNMRDHPVSEEEIKKYLKKQGVDVPRDKRKKYLDLLSRDTPQILRQIQDQNKAQYYVNIPAIMKLVKDKTMDSIIKEKFGTDCLRVFRLLFLKKHLEELQISDVAMIPLKQVRNSLYKMLACDYIQLQELQKGKKHNTSIFLWSVDLPHLYHCFVQHIYKAIKNLMVRLQFEVDNNHLLLLKEEEQERRHDEGSHYDILTGQEKKQLERFYETQKRMQYSIVCLDRTLMILTDKTDEALRKGNED